MTKTDPKGMITYANDIFMNISGYSEDELLKKPHNMIRHPHMPRTIFKLMWERIQQGEEIFAFVCNRCKNGDHYWVLAHVTANVDVNGKIFGYHSNRRTMSQQSKDLIEPLYKRLRSIEDEGQDRKLALETSVASLQDEITRLGFASYDRFILELGR